MEHLGSCRFSEKVSKDDYSQTVLRNTVRVHTKKDLHDEYNNTFYVNLIPNLGYAITLISRITTKGSDLPNDKEMDFIASTLFMRNDSPPLTMRFAHPSINTHDSEIVITVNLMNVESKAYIDDLTFTIDMYRR